ncbi:hypothetical protein F441_02396 [Phytophthora nicotianae CJ01A1]|uniref:Uncharacterized protein n=1 Tax=Phytophthora nicotianae CJ01A1 TaxID=1317063 RepID=W2XP29_PHYNI|nr:hypothetical protein F441_02396 [Phytophthora nicotianae CJ01A1]
MAEDLDTIENKDLPIRPHLTEERYDVTTGASGVASIATGAVVV